MGSLSANELEEIRKHFKGAVITVSDKQYKSVSDTMFFKGSPTVVFQPENSDDVAVAIKFCEENSLKLSIRSGGHSGAGFGTNDGGAVIDLSALNKVEMLDEKKHIVRLEPGAKWGEAAKILHEHGLAVSSGDTLSVGVGGLTLGGGIGWMVRKYGLAIDSLVGAELVTADGKILHASKDENVELFWALRGGGGNFGVVTAFEFAAHPVGKVYFGNIVYGLDNLQQLITGWRDAMRGASEDLTTMLVIFPSFMGMPPSAIIMCCFASDDKKVVDKALTPLRNLGKILSDDVAEHEYFEVLQEAHPPQGVYGIIKNGFAKDFSDELVKTIAGLFHGNEGPVLQIRSVGGAMNRVSADATAFAHRDSEIMIVCPTFVPMDASAIVKQRALGTWNKIAAYTNGGYVNFFSEHDEDLSVMYPKATLERLTEVKKAFDPQNIFNQNFNIKI